MSNRRLIKQGSYAFGCLIFLVAIVSIILLVLSGPRARDPLPAITSIPNTNLKIEQVSFIAHSGAIDMVARLRNPNAHAGVRNLPVKFIARDRNDNVLATNTVSSYILPGNIQYVAALGVKASGTVAKVNVELPNDIVFTSIPNSLQLPTFNSFSYDRTIKYVGTNIMEEQRGLITNNSTFDFQRVEVTVLGFDKNENIVGVGTTFLGALMVNEQREYSVEWFKPASATERVIVFPTTNMFLEDNILRVIGNPSLLR